MDDLSKGKRLFDIKAKIEKDLKNFDEIRKEIEAGNIEDYFLITRFKDKDRACEFSYQIESSDQLMWVGIFEYLKYLILYSQELD